MGRVVLGLAALTAVVIFVGCEDTYDCEEACELMRDCGLTAGTSQQTCEVRCIERESSLEEAIDSCGECLDTEDCSAGCLNDCVCALSLDTAEYSDVYCGN